MIPRFERFVLEETSIRLFAPYVGREELANVSESIERRWLGLGQNVSSFEEQFLSLLGAEAGFALNSGTAALHLALSVFGFPTGAKVLVPALTFSASASAILYNNLQPVFVDSDPKTLGLDIDDLERKWDPECVALIAVHYAGHPLPMEKIMEWAGRRNVRVIEDCAHTIGSEYLGTPLGLWGDVGCFSFEEKKILTTGDGGMIVSRHDGLLDEIPAKRWVGIDKENWVNAQRSVSPDADGMHWYYELSVLGWKYNMNDLSAAIGLAQIQKLPEILEKRTIILERYLLGFSQETGVEVLLPYLPSSFAYQIFGVRVDNRQGLMKHLTNAKISSGSHYTPLSLQPLFEQFGRGSCPFIEAEADRFVTLPFHPGLSIDDVDRVVENVVQFNASVSKPAA